MPKPPGLCIFCGKGHLSKEHVFADWLRALYPRTPHDRRIEGETWLEEPSRSWTGPLCRSLQGHTGSKKVRVVCKTCNNTWMSAIDEATKPILTPLISGHPVTLDEISQRKLATWITKVVIVSEYMYPKNRAISKEETLWFYQSRSPFDNWKICIANYSGINWSGLYVYHNMIRFDLSPAIEVSLLSRNTHSTTIGMGNLFIHVMGTSVKDLTFQLDNNSISDLVGIWPITRTAITWPLARMRLDDRGADFIANTLNRIAGHPSGRLR
jgi:hypothetical protein